MQDTGVPVHRRTDGGIDYEGYRREAARLRQEVRRDVWRRIRRALAGRRRGKTARAGARSGPRRPSSG